MLRYKEIIEKIKPELEKAILALKRDVQTMRTGRPLPTLIENIEITYYGQKMVLKQIASISIVGPREIFIQPWDKDAILLIEKAIFDSGLGLNPIVEKEGVRLVFPPLSEEMRKELLKILNERLERTRRTIRKWRDEAWWEVQKAVREGKIREDDKFRAKNELQKLVEEYIGKVEEIGELKKKEILE